MVEANIIHRLIQAHELYHYEKNYKNKSRDPEYIIISSIIRWTSLDIRSGGDTHG